MSLPLELLDTLSKESSVNAWSKIATYAWDVCSQPLPKADSVGAVRLRDQRLEALDLFLSHAAWELWAELEGSLEAGAAKVAGWWKAHTPGRAVLILDGLSLREVPWLLGGASEHGFAVRHATVVRAELPADTVFYARALGFSSRSALANSATSGLLPGARTETLDAPFEDCLACVGAEPDWLFWHHWPDHRLHELDQAGKGLTPLTGEVDARLTGEGFWKLLQRLATGRRLVITSDHGYAATGYFSDSDAAETQHLKALFKSGRHAPGEAAVSNWLPPIHVSLKTRWDDHSFALGRRRWKSEGGYPTLTHGGLTVLEVLTPFIELERT